MLRGAVLLVLLSAACARSPTEGPATAAAPDAPAPTAPAEHEPAADNAPARTASTHPTEASPPRPEIAQPGFEVGLRCAPKVCKDAPWLMVDFTNGGTDLLVLEVPPASADTRTWTPTRVSARWSNGIGFGSAVAGPLRSTHYVPAWDGQALVVERGATESFAVVLDETRVDDLHVELQISWRQSPTRAAADARDAAQAWVVQMQVGTPRRRGCAPVTCDIKPADEP